MGELAAEQPADQGGLLVVDDEPFLRDAVAASLRFLGFEVTTAETAADALRLAREHPFDLVVLDVLLPDGDGFDVVRRLRRDGSSSTTSSPPWSAGCSAASSPMATLPRLQVIRSPHR